MSGELQGQVVLVTGATGAIGTAVVERASAAGALVVASDAVAADDAAALTLANTGDIADYISCDISKEWEVRGLLTTILARHGRLDGAANVAGIIGPSVTTVDYDEESWRRVIDVNLVGTWLCVKHELKAMLDHGGGAIVNVASVAGHVGECERSAYVASKAGVVGMTKTAAVEYARLGIRVNAISPGPIDTAQFHANVGAPGTERYLRVTAAQPSRRLGRADEVAAAIVWLLSDGSSFVVGHELIVDGGLLAEGLAPPEVVATVRV
jgi:NAD(P)-dependent dehydrogenase (short-subunit alcohol dehydrogenase family)